MNQVAKGRRLPDLLQRRLREEVARYGERVVRERLGLTRGPFARCIGGLTVYEGTILQVEVGLGREALSP